MTTGRALIRGKNDYDTLVAIAEKEAPKPSLAVVDYPKELEAIVMKALARRVSERWQSAREMQLALEDLAVKRHWPQSSSGLSSLMEEHFAQEIAALRGSKEAGQNFTDFAVRELAEAHPTPSAVGTRAKSPASAAVDRHPVESRIGTVVPLGRPPPTLSKQAHGPKRRSGLVVPFAILCVCVGVGVGIGFLVGKKSQPPAVVTPLTVEAPPAEAPPDVTTLIIETPPASAALDVAPPPESGGQVEDSADETELAPLEAPPTVRPQQAAELSGDHPPVEAPPRRSPRRASSVAPAATWTRDSPFPPP